MTEDRPPPTVLAQPSQGVAGVATTVIDSLRGQPNLLLVFLLNAAFIVGMFYYLIDERRGRQSTLDKILDNCIVMTKP